MREHINKINKNEDIALVMDDKAAGPNTPQRLEMSADEAGTSTYKDKSAGMSMEDNVIGIAGR